MVDLQTKDVVVRVKPPVRSGGFMLAKRCVQAGCILLTGPRLVSYWLGRQLIGRRAFSAASESISRIPGSRGVYLRQAFYRRTLSHCGQDVYFGWLSVFSMTEARVGDRAYIGRYCSIGYAEIGDDVMLADGVQILSGGREHERAADTDATTMHDMPQTYRPIRVANGAWIGAGAIIMGDVGEGAIVGAGAVVTKPVPARSVAVGVPARVISGSREA